MILLGASVTGRMHLFREANAQDAFAIAAAPGARTRGVGVVCDGCGAEPRSEVGAALVARCVSVSAARRLADGQAAEAVALAVAGDVLEALASIALAATRGRDVEEFVHEHLLTTTLVLVDDGTTLAIAAWGDGVVALDDHVVSIDEGGTPRYLGYALLDGSPAPAPSFSTAVASAGVERAAIATDGLSPHLVGGCFGHRGRGLQRWLNLRARLDRLDDDATVVVREPTAGGAS